MVEATLSSKNQIVIPKEAREALGLKAGDKVTLVVRPGRVLLLETPKKYRDAIRGIGRGDYRRDYLRQERRSWR